jgi:hypothetical protein
MPDAFDCCILIKLVILYFKILLGFKLLLWLWLIVVKKHTHGYNTLSAQEGTDV